jgi:hypothetical protein
MYLSMLTMTRRIYAMGHNIAYNLTAGSLCCTVSVRTSNCGKVITETTYGHCTENAKYQYADGDGIQDIFGYDE